MNRARQRLFIAAIVQTQSAFASRSASPIAAARQWQEGQEASFDRSGCESRAGKVAKSVARLFAVSRPHRSPRAVTGGGAQRTIA
jgi:hypothetical protein